MSKNPLVSILISTKNSEKYLAACLDSVKSQTYKNWEVILVDNYSTDKTRDIAKAVTKQIYIKGPERSTQYNLAAKKAKGKYLYRIDSDFVLEKRVVEECVQLCEDGNFDGVAVHNTSDDSLGFWSKVRKLERECYKDDDSIVAVRFMSKKAFDTIGGFDERMYAGEDYDLHNRFVEAGFKWGRINAKEIHLGEVTSIWLFAKQSFRYGKNLPFYMEKHPDVGKRQMTPLRPAFFKHWRELAKHPTLTLGLFIMFGVKFAAGGLGYSVAKLNFVKHENV
jgi:glycosyltransferase involved in cell wall biosynthesis